MKLIKTNEALFYPRFAIEKKNDFYCKKIVAIVRQFFGKERYTLKPGCC